MDFKIFKRIFLIIFLVLATFSFNEAKCAEISCFNETTISAPISIEKGFLNTKENELTLSCASSSEQTIANRRNNNQDYTSSCSAVLNKLIENNNIISYFSNSLYLDTKNELALLFLKHQIHPQAP